MQVSMNKKGVGALVVMFMVCAFILFGMFVISTTKLYFLTKDMTGTLDIYVHKDDESTSLASLMGAERGDYLYMELLGYKSLNNYNSYLGPEMTKIYYTMGEMGRTYNLDIYYNTKTTSATTTISSGSGTITVPKPDSAGKCSTDPNPGLSLAWPLKNTVPYHISSGFGWRKDPVSGGCACHGGLDIAASEGSDILASADGKVVFAAKGTQGSGYNLYGNTVSIYHRNYGYSTMYGHMQDNSITVKIGQDVKKGQVIGKLGNTGKSTGPHLHFEVDKGEGRASSSSARNPCVFLSAVPDKCIHIDVDVCTTSGLSNTGMTAQTTGTITTVTKSSSEDVTILPEDYVTEIPLPGAQLGYIKGVVGGLIK